MTTVFWDCEWVLVVDVVPRGETIDSDAAYIRLQTEHEVLHMSSANRMQ